MFAPLQAAPGGYGWALLQTTLALAFVCLLAVVILRWLSQRGVGVPRRRGRLRVLDRVSLDRRRAVLTVAVGPRVLLVGVGDSGPPSLLMELDDATAAEWLDERLETARPHERSDAGASPSTSPSSSATTSIIRSSAPHRS